jgi:hypothetical protein
MSIAVLVLAAALVGVAIAILAIGAALALGIAIIGIALAYGAMILAYAVLVGIGVIFGFAMAAVTALMAMSVLAAGALLAATFLFTGMLVASMVGLVAGIVTAILILFLIGLFLIGATAMEIWEKLKPYWERLKNVWDSIVAWWEQCWLKRLLDNVDEAGGWWNWIKNIFKSLFNRIKNYLASTKLAKWISGVADWWKNFSFKNMFKALWTKIKNWLLGIWNSFCGSAAGLEIWYPTISVGIGWWGMVPYPTISFGSSAFRPFSFMENWKSEINENETYETPATEMPADQVAEENTKQIEEMSKEIELSESEVKEIEKNSENIFEMHRKISEALKKKREANKNK